MASLVQWGFQDGSSFLMEQLIFFHDHAMMILILVMSLVGYGSVALLFSKFTTRSLLESELAETIWTIAPFFVLLFLALPSLRLLYLMDEIYSPTLSIKIIGHQWYWSYEYSGLSLPKLDSKSYNKICSDLTNSASRGSKKVVFSFVDNQLSENESIKFDSYMIPTSDLNDGDFNLLEVDNHMVVPVNTPIRLLITGADVIHSWTVPSLGIKVDAVPGRLNQASLFVKQTGIFFGQCSEICGANHAFMPIVLESVPLDLFEKWCSSESDAIIFNSKKK